MHKHIHHKNSLKRHRWRNVRLILFFLDSLSQCSLSALKWSHTMCIDSSTEITSKRRTANTKCNQNEKYDKRKKERNKHPLDDFIIVHRKKKKTSAGRRTCIICLTTRFLYGIESDCSVASFCSNECCILFLTFSFCFGLTFL